jgi:hypothetical protein
LIFKGRVSRDFASGFFSSNIFARAPVSHPKAF